jgi:hypothetical protein
MYEGESGPLRGEELFLILLVHSAGMQIFTEDYLVDAMKDLTSQIAVHCSEGSHILNGKTSFGEGIYWYENLEQETRAYTLAPYVNAAWIYTSQDDIYHHASTPPRKVPLSPRYPRPLTSTQTGCIPAKEQSACSPAPIMLSSYHT